MSENNMFISADEDYLGWLEQQISLINEGKIQDLDIDEIKEILEAAARAEVSSAQIQLMRLQINLLKLKYHPTRQRKSWSSSILKCLSQIERKLEGNKTLRNKMTDEVMLREYGWAVKYVVAETGLDIKTFPKEPEWSLEQLIDPDFCDEWLAKYKKK